MSATVMVFKNSKTSFSEFTSVSELNAFLRVQVLVSVLLCRHIIFKNHIVWLNQLRPLYTTFKACFVYLPYPLGLKITLLNITTLFPHALRDAQVGRKGGSTEIQASSEFNSRRLSLSLQHGERTAPAARTRAFAVFYTGTIGAGALAPFAYGFVSDALGVSATIAMIAAVALLTLPLAAALRGPLRQASELGT
jgi:hypothetical protein